MATKKPAARSRKRALQARDIMTRKMFTLSASAALLQAVRLFVENHVSAAPVIGPKGMPVGVITKTDLARYEWEKRGFETEEPRPAPKDTNDELVSRWMTPFVLAVAPDAGISEVAKTMVKNGVHHLFVQQGKELLGVISTFDLIRAMNPSGKD